MLKNPYTRIAIAAALSTLIAPTITNKLSQIEMDAGDSLVNNVALYGVAGATTAFVYTVLTMALGPVSTPGA